MDLIKALAAFLIGRKSRRAEQNKTEAETVRIFVDADRIMVANLQTSINIYKGIADDLSKQMELLRKELLVVNNELHAVRKENAALKKQLAQLNTTLNHQ